MKSTVFSFDVFDTCLVRTFARPEDVFAVLGQTVLPKSVFVETITEFATARIQAEAAARRVVSREDITLVDIYQNFRALTYWQLKPEPVMAAEVSLEIGCVRPIAVIQQRIIRLKQQGHRVIFISDMYLPRSVIQLMLANHGFAAPSDSLYVSGDIGLTKRSGRLFEYVLQQEKLQPDQLWHTGDNPHGDVLKPRRLGIKTTYFRQSQLNRYEHLIMSQPSDQPRQLSQLAGISRMVRLKMSDGTQLDALVNLTASVIAPLLVTYVAWVLQNACQQGVERLYFVSRDGQILYKIAQILAQHLPAPECRYLYGSRQAWFLPAVKHVDRVSLGWLTLHSKTPRHLLHKLNLVPEEISTILLRHGFTKWDTQLDENAVEQFWQVIEHPEVTRLILQRAADARAEVLTYFAQEGLLSTTHWAMVDVGWAARGQRAVRKIIRSREAANEAIGYYLALAENRLSITESGPYFTFLPQIENAGFDSITRCLLNHTIVVEHLFTMADHGSVIRYQQNGQSVEPILADLQPSESLLQLIDKFQHVILQYVDEITKVELLTDLNDLRRVTPMCTKLFLETPTYQEAKLVAQIPASIDQTHQHQSYLARPLNITDVYEMFDYFIKRHFFHKRVTYASNFDWLAGSLALSVWLIRFLFLPVTQFQRFKQNNGRFRLSDWVSRWLAKETI